MLLHINMYCTYLNIIILVAHIARTTLKWMYGLYLWLHSIAPVGRLCGPLHINTIIVIELTLHCR